ncbi:hypothetical protein [Nocardia neocaledoniensis]|uniref:hypothetical protein n=1 Tax=Nocardia neocaledoniensis TaxID=236511 RepID=UPI0024549575|nr:hypothetical protein [Nocardia neocaledoniensis]
MLSTVITAGAALIGVVVGGLITIRNQDRQSQREHARQWRDRRLTVYAEFSSAYRAYVAFALEPTANIVMKQHPQIPEMMPFFDDAGRPYKERLEAAVTAVRLVCETDATRHASSKVLSAVRQVAAARATSAADAVAPELFSRLWTAQYEFINAARAEVGLTALENHLPSEATAPSVPAQPQ